MTDPLANVYDDTGPRGHAADWAYDLMLEGWSPEAVEAQLVASGWSPADAAAVAENARKKTRHLRGVVTRDDVSHAVHAATFDNKPALLNAGYIGEPDGFNDTKPTNTPAPGDNVIGYASPPDQSEAKRLRVARKNASVKIVSGAVIMALGTAILVAMLVHTAASGTRVLIAIGMLLGGFLTILDARREHRSPRRLVMKLDPRGKWR